MIKILIVGYNAYAVKKKRAWSGVGDGLLRGGIHVVKGCSWKWNQ